MKKKNIKIKKKQMKKTKVSTGRNNNIKSSLITFSQNDAEEKKVTSHRSFFLIFSEKLIFIIFTHNMYIFLGFLIKSPIVFVSILQTYLILEVEVLVLFTGLNIYLMKLSMQLKKLKLNFEKMRKLIDT